MTTRLYESILRIEERWKESERLYKLAQRQRSSENKSLLNGVTIVLQAAHFEASLKEICEAVVDDINDRATTALLSEDARKNYLRNLFGDVEAKLNSRSGQEGIQKILDWAYRDGLKLDKKRFSDTEANPKPDVIKKLLKQFGVSDFFITVSSTDIEYWLSTNDSNEFRREISRLYRYIKERTKEFPYSIKSDRITINSNAKASAESNVALLTNLNSSLKHRNMVAHSGIMEESISQADAMNAEITFKAITLFFIAAICLEIQKNLSPEGG